MSTNLTEATVEVPSEISNHSPSPTSDADLQLRDIIRSLPPECFHKDGRKALLSVLISLAGATLGYVTIALAPWFLLPLAWILTGTALTGWFVIGHDCGHRSFAKRIWINDWVGHVMMLPLIYPFHAWRLLHDQHHRNTNKLHLDNAWEPWTVEAYMSAKGWMQALYRGLRGGLWWLASIAHWAALHFNPNQVAERDRSKVRFSVAIVILFGAVLFPTLLITLGVWGVIKFWLMPWLVYHFWMSTFTLVHHTDPDVQFRPAETWNEVEAQLEGSIHCSYPAWVEILCHDINVHVPHHISVGIPSYNLRQAHAILKETWGDRIRERQFSWQMMKQIITRCHLYDPEHAYLSFAEAKAKAT